MEIFDLNLQKYQNTPQFLPLLDKLIVRLQLKNFYAKRYVDHIG